VFHIRFYLFILVILLFLQNQAFADRLVEIQKVKPMANPISVIQLASRSQFQFVGNGVELTDAIEAIIKATGITIHYSMLPNAVVSFDCKGSLDQVLLCLLGNRADMVLRRASNLKKSGLITQVTEVWLLSRLSVASKDTPNETKAQDQNQQIDKTEYFLAQVQNPSQRAEGILKLGVLAPKDDLRVRSVLRQGLVDENPIVRAEAVFALARYDGDEAISEIRQAFNDENPGVRMKALQSAGEDRLILLQALNDSDLGIQGFAASKLDLLTKDGNLR